MFLLNMYEPKADMTSL